MSKQITPSLGVEGIISIFFGVVSVSLTDNILWHVFTILGAGLVIPRMIPRGLKKYYEYEPAEYKPGQFLIGESDNGPEIFSFGDSTPHLLVAGATGNGKTSFLRNLITTLILNHSGKVKLWLIDLKRIEFPLFEKVSIVERIGYTEEEAVNIIQRLVRELHRRLALFHKIGINNIKSYHGKMPRLVCIIDEYALLKRNQEFQDKLEELLQQGRACGIHFVIATQRPEREVLKGSIKANIEYKVCFKVTNRVNSQIILDGDEAAELPEIKGRAIFQRGKNIEVQTPYLSEKKALSLIEKEKRPAEEQYEIDFGGVVRD